MRSKKTGWSFAGALLFFLTIGITVTFAVLSYVYIDNKTNGNRNVVALVMLLIILFLSTLCTLCDIVRRRLMVERPTEQILTATERIAAGDFTVRLSPRHAYGKYDEYDVIMENLNTMVEALGQSEALNADFISNVSHELKTPLTIIQSYAVLLKRESDPEKRKEYAEVLVHAAKRLNNLVSSILKLNKLENEKLLPEKTKFRLDEALTESILTFEDRIEDKNIELVCDLEEVEIEGALGYLEIVWNNLLSNAIKFTEDGGRVAVTLKKEDKIAVICVTDTGCGISAETGKRIFDKFYQGDTSHAQEGNGLGLALVKRVIDVIGGEISVSSELGKGSTFTVVLKETIV